LEEKKPTKTLGENLLDIENHGLSLLKTILLPIIVFYISLSPHTAAVFLIEYFKIDPSIALIVLQFSFPVLIGIVIARTLSTMWYTVFVYVLALAVIVPLLPVLWFLRIFKYSCFERFFQWLDALGEKYKNRKKKERKFLLSNQILAITLIVGLYFAQFYDNFIGKTWNPTYNKKLMIIANLHYYCQVTGSYNDEQCQKWKAEMKSYNQRMSSQIRNK
jgi:hypothetical protein